MKIAVVIPCFNEELTVAKVVADARRALPAAEIWVFDNASTDQTAARAREAQARVVESPVRGKGNVIRHAFRVVDADILLLTDGDGTYPMAQAPKLVSLIMENGHDMAVGTRLKDFGDGSFRPMHVFGNRLFSRLVGALFRQRIDDMLSGFRALSREFYKLVPLHSRGFEVEIDLTLQAMSKGFSLVETPVTYGERPTGSYSKLKTYEDGFLLMQFLFRLARDYRPLPFFGVASLACFVLGLAAGWAPIADFVEHHYVYTVPRAILAAGLMILSVVLVGVGLILDSQIRSFNEQFQLGRRLLQRFESRDESATARPRLVAGE